MATQFSMFEAFTPPAPVQDVAPNEHGVYDTDTAEALILPCLRKGWRGMPDAEINLLHIAEGWICRVSANSPNSGFSSPLAVHHTGAFATRREALDHAISQIEKWARPRHRLEDEAALVRVRKWLETLD
jgi:hypothetical protein